MGKSATLIKANNLSHEIWWICDVRRQPVPLVNSVTSTCRWKSWSQQMKQGHLSLQRCLLWSARKWEKQNGMACLAMTCSKYVWGSLYTKKKHPIQPRTSINHRKISMRQCAWNFHSVTCSSTAALSKKYELTLNQILTFTMHLHYIYAFGDFLSQRWEWRSPV